MALHPGIGAAEITSALAGTSSNSVLVRWDVKTTGAILPTAPSLENSDEYEEVFCSGDYRQRPRAGCLQQPI